MPRTIGIPRGLFFYKYYPLWKCFFEELGAEVIVSGHTSKQILDNGVRACVDEACLPVKVYHGHVLEVRGKVDCIFIPRFTSISRNEYVCPKFGGLPDMIRHSIKDLPEIIDAEVNLRRSGRNIYKAVYEWGRYFTDDKRKIRKAYKRALNVQREYVEQIKRGMLPQDIIDRRLKVIKSSRERNLKIALIGHVYNLYDEYVNMNLVRKLREGNIDIFTVDMVEEEEINKKVRHLPKKMFWNFGRHAMGCALHIIEREDIDGIVYLMSFGCGVDAFICDLVERRVRRDGRIPFIALTLDEHSGEAGLNTRLEAFIDMIRWRNLNEGNLSAYGQHIHLR